ncbi:MAG: hypothetical protein UV79_C0013G0005 [candidate division TM6 bacterium GW2011_GWF2_43_17]|nr:MAG: hypothetical protein UV79_C0013G0005 [candidate division TM6 bacterium GW2011_GWF2_43_17]
MEALRYHGEHIKFGSSVKKNSYILPLFLAVSALAQENECMPVQNPEILLENICITAQDAKPQYFYVPKSVVVVGGVAVCGAIAYMASQFLLPLRFLPEEDSSGHSKLPKVNVSGMDKIQAKNSPKADIRALDIKDLCNGVNPGTFSFNELKIEGFSNGNELQRLREWSKKQKVDVSKAPFTITILSGPKAGDVSCLESDPENNGAAFMVASNANALYSVCGQLISSKRLHTDIWTQEANAVLPTVPAYESRYKNFGSPSVHVDWVSNPAEQKSLMVFDSALKKEDLFRYKNGYVAFKLEKLGFIKNKFKSEDIVQMVAYHQDAPVVLYKKFVNGVDGWYYAPEKSKQKIDHIIAAAVNIGEKVSNLPDGYVCGIGLDGKVDSATIAKKALETSYEHAILLAAFHKKEKLFLTLLGAGVFGNQAAWVQDAIVKAINKHRHLLDSMKIYVIDYSGKTDFSQLVKSGLRISK